MSMKERLECSRESYNVEIRRGHKQRMLLTKRREIVKWQDEQEQRSRYVLVDGERTLRLALQESNWKELVRLLESLAQYLSCCTAEASSQVAESNIADVVCKAGWKAVHDHPPEELVVLSQVVTIFWYMFQEENNCVRLGQVMGHFLDLILEKLLRSPIQLFYEILEIMELLMENEITSQQMYLRRLHHIVLERCRIDRSVMDAKLAKYLNMLLFYHPSLDREEPYVLNRIGDITLQLIFRRHELKFDEEEDSLRNALSVVLQLLKQGADITPPTSMFVDLIGLPALEKRDLLKIINILEQLVYKNNVAAHELGVKTIFLARAIDLLRNHNHDIRSHCLGLLINMASISHLVSALRIIIADLMTLMLLETDEELRGKYFLIVMKWTEAAGFRLDEVQIGLIRTISMQTTFYCRSDPECQLVFWKKMRDTVGLPPPQYILDVLSDEEAYQYFRIQR